YRIKSRPDIRPGIAGAAGKNSLCAPRLNSVHRHQNTFRSCGTGGRIGSNLISEPEFSAQISADAAVHALHNGGTAQAARLQRIDFVNAFPKFLDSRSTCTKNGPA